ncbi:MAG: HAMP domain-containing sensor histidine kinase, partial [Chloroflexi bacterium]|nr:HAMP domain-containing sensor histidine kinase [Chloroflexota bacterium]
FDRMAITFVDPETNTHRIEFVSGVEVDGFRVGDVLGSLGLDERRIISTRAEWDEVSGDAVRLRDASQLASRMLSTLGTRSALLGAIVVTSNTPNVYDQHSADFLDRVANQITPAIRNARMLAAERELRETLDRQNQELFEANNARKMFLSTVSHELKTPLTIISGFVDLLADDDMDQTERDETLSIVRRNANQLDVLINDILDISRMDAGTFKISKSSFNVNELLKDLDASFQSFIGVKAQTIQVFMPDDEIWLEADRTRIGQLVTNLLSNASKYSPDNTVIELRCEVDGDQLHVAVTDHGIGISEEAQEQLFTAFFRVDNESTRKVSGTGLGLVIAKSIVELHGGEIRLASKEDEGTTIEFWLPGLTSKEASEPASGPEVFTGSRLWADTAHEALAEDTDFEDGAA